MAKQILFIVETAYRANLQEQDDPVLWLVHSLIANGAQVDVLLRGSAVNYAVKGQDASGLSFGERKQTQPPRIADNISALVDKQAKVYYVEEEAAARGIAPSELLDVIRPIRHSAVPALFEQHAQIYRW